MAVETEVCAEDIIAQKADLFGLGNRDTQTLDSCGILRTYIEVSVLCTDCVTGDHHTFDDCKRIPFKDGTVHECAGVAFVAVADHVFVIALRVVGKLPFAAGRETGAAASTDTGGKHLVDNFLGRHGKRALQALESAHAERFFDVLRIDNTASMQGDTSLFLIEVDLILFGDLLAGGGLFIEEAFYDHAAFDVRLHDLLDIFDLNQTIQRIFRIDLDERSLGTETEASDLINGSTICKTLFLKHFFKVMTDLGRIIGQTACTAAQHDMTLSVRAGKLLIQTFRTRSNTLVKIVNRLDHAPAPSFPCFFS